MTPFQLATSYAERLSSCKTNNDFAFICAEITIDLMDVPGLMEWREWLLDMTDTTWHNINDKVIPFEDILNTRGLAALKRGEI